MISACSSSYPASRSLAVLKTAAAAPAERLATASSRSAKGCHPRWAAVASKSCCSVPGAEQTW